jgi:DMSO/TMAO reductase YedYZ molybdopterin-dependent catalytic subunit
MKSVGNRFLREHRSLTRRYFLGCGAAGFAAMRNRPLAAAETESSDELKRAIEQIESWLTTQDDFQDVSRGNPKPHSLDEESRKRVGLTRDSWKLEVLSDPDHPAVLTSELSAAQGTAFDFQQLMQLAKTKSVRFAKVMTCLNIGCPLGNGIWEGVPLREVLWMTKPRKDLRRVFYYGYHNEKPEQMFRSSLPVGRVLEDPFDLPPVILCYKLNGEFLTPERGGPVRVVVPEAYGFKSIKWLSHLYLSNISAANDTYAEKNNDVDSPLKTFCATLLVPKETKPNQPLAITGYAQVGISGLEKVQVWIQKSGEQWPRDDEYFLNAPWQDAEILPSPAAQGGTGDWGGDLADNRIPDSTIGFDSATGRPDSWPMRLTKAHWAIMHPGLEAGDYVLRCRTVDEKGNPQPLPRPFRKSGRAFIERISIRVAG